MTTSALLTAEELLQVSIPDKHVELVRGVLVVLENALSSRADRAHRKRE